MNTLEKYRENEEHKAFMVAKAKTKRLYNLHQCLRKKFIRYNRATKTIYAGPGTETNKHVLELQKKYNYQIQLIIA